MNNYIEILTEREIDQLVKKQNKVVGQHDFEQKVENHCSIDSKIEFKEAFNMEPVLK